MEKLKSSKSKNIDSIDSNSLELVYIYINKYKIFERQGFCFCPEYEVISAEKNDDEALFLKIKTKENFVDLFEDENISLTIICGKNGTGKSTLLEIIKSEIENVIYVYKDENENFYATGSVKLEFDGREINVCDVQKIKVENINKFNPSKQNIVEYIYKYYNENNYKNVELFDNILPEEDDLFSHFRVAIWDIKNEFSDLQDDYGDLLTSKDYSNLRKNVFAICVLSDAKFMMEFKNKKKNLDNSNRKCLDLLSEFFHSNIYDYNELCDLQEELFNGEYKISDFKKVKSKVKKLEELCCKISGLKKSYFDKKIFFDGYKKFDDDERHFEDLSSGEYNEFKYRYQVFSILKEETLNTWVLDEAETFLHPDWCRSFLHDFLQCFRDIKNIPDNKKFVKDKSKNRIVVVRKKEFDFSDKKKNFIISTHSPFLLSDVTNDYIIYLERQKDGSTKQVLKDKNTFAGNIGELFTENFFMENTIGDFASEKIRKIIKKLKSKKTIDYEKMTKYKSLIDCVGDDLLRTLLTDMWEMKKNEKNKSDR
ncbi:AAA family ATPase [uncultured Treponema sp.]|uniref:AAA family ATPase n=1 Tax=uncultured Treponema sp. TaxID=162155 RepID=UPI0025F8F9B1|nr:AAA family ATPase [uncultured Treponema sp.]